MMSCTQEQKDFFNGVKPISVNVSLDCVGYGVLGPLRQGLRQMFDETVGASNDLNRSMHRLSQCATYFCAVFTFTSLVGFGLLMAVFLQ